MCKKLEFYNDLKVMLDNYGIYIYIELFLIYGLQ